MRLGCRQGLVLVFLWAGIPALVAQTDVPSAETQRHIERVEAGLVAPVIVKGDAHAAHTLQDRMAALHIPGVSIALIHHGQIEWAQGFGVMKVGGPAVTAETLFQAGSISKPVAAMAALKLVQEGKLSLDTDVNMELKSWKLPYGPEAKGKVVTLRELLTHTGGTTVHGFPGYAAGEPVPTLVQVLNGEKPANTPAIRVETEPGTKWNYSGGGITIMQLMMIEASGEAFPKLLHDAVLAPIGMTHSTYLQPLPEDWKAMAATPYENDGKPVAGGAHTYPEMAAAGLWTTPTDLAKYAIEVERSLVGEANHVLSKEMTAQMLTPGMGDWGLGVEIGGSKADPYFTHGGVDEGFESYFAAYEKGGEGAVVMTNAQGGEELAQEVMRSIAAEYGWADFKPKVVMPVAMDPKIVAEYVGTYEVGPNFDIVIALKDGHLVASATGQNEEGLIAESSTKFMVPAVGAEFEFVPDAQGKVTYLVLNPGGRQMKAMKK
ncbi:MAG: serine hydrolase [Acidobacteriaceae bacterium]|jgi:CubicO group peptidase (beta-lactamase class C family)